MCTHPLAIIILRQSIAFIIFCMCVCREKYKLKEREEVWHKIEELAQQNPQVGPAHSALLPTVDHSTSCFYFSFRAISSVLDSIRRQR